MKTSFRKFNSSSNTNVTPKNHGLKTWINGQSLVSTGLKQLDEILGGGYALGTFICIEEDELSSYAQTLLCYSMAESLSQNQDTIIISSSEKNVTSILSHLPYNLSRSDVTVGDDKTLTEVAVEPVNNQLKVAWQYGKYINPPLSSNPASDSCHLHASKQLEQSAVYCHSYDLSRRLQDSLRSSSLRVMRTLDNFPTRVDANLQSQMEQLVAAISGIVQQSLDAVHRIFIPQLFGVASLVNMEDEQNVRIVTHALLTLKHIIRSSRSTLILSLPTTFLPSTLVSNVMTISDTLVSVTSFAGKAKDVPAEFREFCGFLSIQKLQQVGAIVSHRPQYERYGLKRDRRKLHIEPLHLPPEESRATASDTERIRGGGVGLPCAVSLSGSGSLDF